MNRIHGFTLIYRRQPMATPGISLPVAASSFSMHIYRAGNTETQADLSFLYKDIIRGRNGRFIGLAKDY